MWGPVGIACSTIPEMALETDPVTNEFGSFSESTLVDRVMHWLRHPLTVRRLMDWPCLAELFQSNLRDRVIRIVSGKRTAFAPPLQFLIVDKPYFYPGSLDDMIVFHAAVLGCLPAISQNLGAAADEQDLTPPLAEDLMRGECGSIGMMALHWQRLVKRVEELRFEGGVVVHADVRRCFPSIDRQRVIQSLEESAADSSSINRLNELMGFWEQHHCPGVPMTMVSWLLVKLALQPVDRELQRVGIRSLRLGDDYRLLCPSDVAAQSAVSVLAGALADAGLEMSAGKTWFERWGDPGDARQRRQRIWKGRMKVGLVRPLLAESLRFPVLRPMAFPLLRWLASPHRVMTPAD